MPKRSGMKGSRGARKASRERAERARQHGLPERQQPLPRAHVTSPELDDSAEGPSSGSGSSPPRAGVPTVVKVVLVALALLIAGYVLSLLRDRSASSRSPSLESPAAASSSP